MRDDWVLGGNEKELVVSCIAVKTEPGVPSEWREKKVEGQLSGI